MGFKAKILGAAMVLFLFFQHAGEAQTFSEWFRQKKTQKEYLIAQVAGLQMYIGHARDGYRILRQGWDMVGRARDGEFVLHRDFLTGLSAISPAVKKHNGIPRFVERQQLLLREIKLAKKLLAAHARIKTGEGEYLEKVLDGGLRLALELMDGLVMTALEPGLEMDDAERTARIGALNARLEELYVFIRAFNAENYKLLRHRAWESADYKVLQELHKIRPQ